jgi:regulatory protein SWI6
MHAQLRECSVQLEEERQNLKSLQKRASEKAERRRKIYNLRRALEDKRAGIINANSYLSLKLGDVGLTLASEPPKELLQSENITQNSLRQLDREQLAYIFSLPSTSILRARLAAYTENNKALRGYSAQLRSRSQELEEMYCRIVALCTGIKNEEVEGVLAGLVTAIESEGMSICASQVS